MNIVRQPIQPFLKNTAGGLVFTAPLDQFLAHIQVSFFFALFISSPYWLHQAWLFIAPGLYKNEKKVFLWIWFSGLVLFLLGVLFATFIVFPLVFRVLLQFGNTMDQPLITIKNYLSFFIRSSFIFGLVFEMPLFLTTACYMGFFSPSTLKKYRRQVIVLMAIISALITPPDILSMLLILLPLIGLYELSIHISSLFKIKDRNQ